MANICYKTHKFSTFKARNGLFSQFYIGKHTFVLTMAIYPCKRIHTKKCTLGLEFGLQMPPNCLKLWFCPFSHQNRNIFLFLL